MRAFEEERVDNA